MKIFTSKASLALGVLAVALVGFLTIASGVYTASLETRNLGAAVFAFAARHNRMPQSIDELVQAGYARPADPAGTYVMRADPQAPPLRPAVTANRFEVAWGLQPDQLVEHDKGVFWREDPARRVLLVRHTDPPLAVRALRGRLALAFPLELYHELIGNPAAPATQPPNMADRAVPRP